MNVDVGGWAILLFWCLVVVGVLLGVRWLAISAGRTKCEDRSHITNYLQLLGESVPPRRPRPVRGRPLPLELAWEVYATIERVHDHRIRRLMLEGLRQIEQDAVPATGRTVFGRLWSLQDEKP